MTKKIILIIISAMLLSACNLRLNGEEQKPFEKVEGEQSYFASLSERTEGSRFSNENFFLENTNNSSYVLTDKSTGCKYLVVSQYQAGFGTGVTPLLKSDGTPDCSQ